MSNSSSSKSWSRWRSSGDRWNSGSQNCALKMLPERNASWFFSRLRCSFANCSVRFARLVFWSAACFSAASICVLRASSEARCFATAGVSGAAPSAGGGPSTSSCAWTCARCGVRSLCSFATSVLSSCAESSSASSSLLLDAVEVCCLMRSSSACICLSCATASGSEMAGAVAPTPLATGAEAAAGNADAVAIAANCSSAISAIRRAYVESRCMDMECLRFADNADCRKAAGSR